LYVIPFLILREQWKGSEPEHVDGSDEWKRSPDTPWLWVWFVAYGILPVILIAVALGSTFNTGLGATDLETLADSFDEVNALTYLSALPILVAGVSWIVFVRRLTSRHRALTGER
jgi:hypothetical protein